MTDVYESNLKNIDLKASNPYQLMRGKSEPKIAPRFTYGGGNYKQAELKRMSVDISDTEIGARKKTFKDIWK